MDKLTTMNLIEQLGGYEEACGWLRSLPKGLSKDKSINMVDLNNKNIIHSIFIPKLELEILEYRRANNIFEVGDLVVLTEPLFSSAIWSVHEANNDMVFISKDFGFVPIYKSEVRHATPQEIEAGHRL